MKRIGIIGLGWLGEKLAQDLSLSGNAVWGTVRDASKAEKLRYEGLEVICWTSGDGFSDDLKKALGQTDYLVLNLPPSAFSEMSYAGGLASIAQFVSAKTQVIFTSSTGVYPENLENATEDYIFQAEESNKLLEAEKVLMQLVGSRLCILRLAGLIGEDRHPVFYLAKKEMNPDPEKKVNLIHRKDVIRTINLVIERNAFGEIFNVCHPDHPTRKDYYNRVALHFNLPEIQFQDFPRIGTNKVVNCLKLQVTFDFDTFEDINLK